METRIFRQSDPDYLLSLILRYKILRVPLGLTYSRADLAHDRDDVHIGIFDGDVIVATLVLTDTGGHTIKMRQVAVDAPHQGLGLGRRLVQFADDYARENGYKLIHCHARETAREFYLKQEYKVVGDGFLEIGIPHYYMEKQL